MTRGSDHNLAYAASASSSTLYAGLIPLRGQEARVLQCYPLHERQHTYRRHSSRPIALILTLLPMYVRRTLGSQYFTRRTASCGVQVA